MISQAEKKDLTDVLEFIARLLELLVEQVPGPHRRQFRRVWHGEIKNKLTETITKVNTLTSNSSKELADLERVGWTGEQARLKSDTIATVAGEGALGKVLKLANSSLGSLGVVFVALEPVKEFKDFLEAFIPSKTEPVSEITTLFGKGPIPGPTS
jgi:hypothetical protein